MDNIKDQFPIFKNNKDLVYLDNAATTQKPQTVISSLVEFYETYNSNVHRGLYPISEKATDKYEEARRKIAKFINAEPEEIIFTGGTTNGINAIARSLYVSGLIPEKPRVLLSDLEHHSNILPWQQLPGSQLDYIPLDKNYVLRLSGVYPEFISGLAQDDKPYDVVSLVHVSNVTGSVLDLDLVKKLKAESSRLIAVLDCAQSIGHMPIDVKTLGADLIVFSGHKMYGPTGVGVIWGKREILEQMVPFEVGGGMIREVKRDSATWAELPEKFEAGTPPIADAIALGAAADFITSIGFENIQKNESELRKYAFERLKELTGIEIYHPNLETEAGGVISFCLNNIHPHDIAEYIGKKGICIRAGHHCTQVLHREILDISASARISLGIYNAKEDIDKLIDGLKEAVTVYKK
jgi:cysteine desulfurase/selenocysteine lyase